MKKLVHFLFILLLCFICKIYNYENVEDGFDLLSSGKSHRVDEGVKRPVRFCQGFEDPAEIDCYIRSDIRPYVCTEPVSFNPCESLQRIETFHYDHITHRCNKVNVPACEGQIIRVMTLIQCLIYCHTKDPFALGKSRSMVFKLNQEKPYVPHEKVENEKDIILKIRDGDETISSEDENKQNLALKSVAKSATKGTETSGNKSKRVSNTESAAMDKEVKEVKKSQSIDNENPKEDSFIKALNENAELAEYLVNGNSDLSRKSSNSQSTKQCSNCATRDKKTVKPSTSSSTSQKKMSKITERQTKVSPNEEDRLESTAEQKKKTATGDRSNNPMIKENLNKVKVRAEVKEVQKKVISINEGKKKSVTKGDSENDLSDPKQKKIPYTAKLIKKIIFKRNTKGDKLRLTKVKSDSTDKSRDDGFYLWDEK